MQPGSRIRGRGTALNPRNRFEKLEFSPEPDDVLAEEAVAPDTVILRDSSRTILSHNDSPDIPFRYSINPYRGCEHGCAYCYARPYHEYLGMSAGLDFETKILVKENAARLLREELMSPKWKPDVIVMSGVTDCYQPIERRMKLTRGCLEVLNEFRNPAALITKNRLVTRDIDILGEMAAWNGVRVLLSITTLDPELGGKLEPRASRPSARLEAIRRLADAGIPVGVNAAPMIPGLTDRELPAILKTASEAGASFAGFTIVRLPGAVEKVFSDWIHRELPGHKSKVLNRIRQAHGGRLSDSRFGTRMHGEGNHARQIDSLFHLTCDRLGLNRERKPLSTEHFRRPDIGQLSLFPGID